MKTKKIAHSLFLVVAIVVCLSMLTNSVAALTMGDMAQINANVSASNAGSRVVNGTFETGTIDGWKVEPGKDSSTISAASAVTEDSHSGDYSMKVQKATAEDYYGYQTIVYSPQVGKDYTLSYWAKTTGNAKVATAVLAQGDASTEWETYAQSWFNGEEHFVTATGDWEQRSFNFSLPDNDDIKMVSIRFMIYGNGTAYIDDIEFTEKAITGENLFCNGTFDNGNETGWVMGASQEVPPTPEVTDYSGYNGGAENDFADCNTSATGGAFSVTTEQVHSGSKAFKATRAAADGVNYVTYYGFSALEAGQDYILSYYIKGTGTLSFRSYLLGPIENWCVDERVVTADWQKVTYQFTAQYDTTANGGAQVGFQLISGEGTVYFDDIKITHEELKPLTKTTELLKNNDFASGKANWEFSGNSEIIDQSGTNVIKMTVPASGSEYIQQTVDVKPGKTYDFSADLMTQEQDGDDAQSQVYVIDSNWNMVCPSEYKTYGWKHLTASYTAPAGTTSVTVLLQHNVVAGVSYWKNISFSVTDIVAEEQKEDVFTNGDFETVFASNSAYAYNINDAVAEFTTSNVHSGTYAVKYTSGYFTNYGTSVEPGTYTLSMWVNIVSGDTAEMSGFVSGCGIAWQDFAMTVQRGPTNGWVQISGDVTFTEAGNPTFGFKSYGGSGEVYIDDIKLEKTTYIPVYPSSTYTEGIGTFGGDNGMLKADAKTEWWNYGNTVAEGQRYLYSMDVKVEGSQSGFQFYPYIHNFTDDWQIGTVYESDTDGFVRYAFEFTANAPDQSNGTRFGFARNGTGTVYIDNITLYAVPDEPAPAITSENENLVPNTAKAVAGNSSESISVGNITEGKKYILKFDVVSWDDEDASISAKLGTAGFENLIISQTDSFVSVTAVITAQASGNIPLVLSADFISAENANVVFDNIEFYRVYSLGDVNGDDNINILDLVKYKKYFADNNNKLKTYIYADLDSDGLISSTDLTCLVDLILAQ